MFIVKKYSKLYYLMIAYRKHRSIQVLMVNTDPLGKQGQHWLAFYYYYNGKCTFFDSFGHSPAFFGLEAYIEKTSTK
jgi:hypothetical protein